MCKRARRRRRRSLAIATTHGVLVRSTAAKSRFNHSTWALLHSSVQVSTLLSAAFQWTVREKTLPVAPRCEENGGVTQSTHSHSSSVPPDESIQSSERSREGSERSRTGSERSRPGSGRSRKGSGRSRKGSGRAVLYHREVPGASRRYGRVHTRSVVVAGREEGTKGRRGAGCPGKPLCAPLMVFAIF